MLKVQLVVGDFNGADPPIENQSAKNMVKKPAELQSKKYIYICTRVCENLAKISQKGYIPKN